MSRTNDLQNWLNNESADINNFSEIAPKTGDTTEFSKVGDKFNGALTNVGQGISNVAKKAGSGVFRAGQKLNTSPKAKKIAGGVALGAAGLAAGVGAAAIAKHAANKRAERDESVRQQAVEDYREEQRNKNKPKQIAASEFSNADIDEIINNSVAEFSDALNEEFGETEVDETVEKTDKNGEPTEEEISETINNSFSEYCELFSEMGLFGECNFSDYDMDATCEAAFGECEDKMVDAIIEKAEKEYDHSEDGEFSEYLADEVAFSVAMNYFGFSEEDFADIDFAGYISGDDYYKAYQTPKSSSSNSTNKGPSFSKKLSSNFRKFKRERAKAAEARAIAKAEKREAKSAEKTRAAEAKASAKAAKDANSYKVSLNKDKDGKLSVTETNTEKDKDRIKAAKSWAKGNKKGEIDLIKKYGNTGKAARAAAWGSRQKDSLIKSLGGGSKRKGQKKLDEYKRMATDAAMTGIARKLSGESSQRDEEIV